MFHLSETQSHHSKSTYNNQSCQVSTGSLKMDDEIKILKDRELTIQKQLGRGSFGTVHLAHCDDPEVTNPVVMKPFKRDLKVNVVNEVLSVIARSDDKEYDHLIPAIASEITKGLSHLHELDVAHRDLKPANVLISNQHYSALQDKQQMNRIKALRPVVCKLADFGESRSQLLQTSGMNDPSTNWGYRGTPTFMAPEILLPERMLQGKKLSLDDLKKIDIWALGLVFYCLINPGVLHPYELDATGLPDIYMMLRQRQLPSANPQYQTKQATVWSRVKVAFEACANHDPSKRAKASDVLDGLNAPRDPGPHNILVKSGARGLFDSRSLKLRFMKKITRSFVLGC
ncbi:serine/threonine protein kinase [Desmophyllum pertusum]|uniref:Serine/threonine protein kinase n=1 Tax=Desmophyllum pertusum TaxID=174260 RepID=A0A9W9ZPS0_9CNID|nr:serine/threonine protein kinase [Desmophyllum pertusum]